VRACVRACVRVCVCVRNCVCVHAVCVCARGSHVSGDNCAVWPYKYDQLSMQAAFDTGP